jgi:hypothetical protein
MPGTCDSWRQFIPGDYDMTLFHGSGALRETRKENVASSAFIQKKFLVVPNQFQYWRSL